MAEDEPTRIPEEHEAFLRAVRSKNVAQVKSLLERDTSLLNCVEAGGFAALHFAAFNGDTNMIKFLVDQKANLNITNYDGNTPLVMAAKGKQHAAMRALVEAGADVNFSTKTGSTAIHHSAFMGDLSGMKEFVKLGAKTEFEKNFSGTLLHWACQSGDLSCIGSVIYDFGIGINEVDAHGGTALFTALFMDKPQVVLFLLEHGADPNVSIPGDRTTPLHIAAEYDSCDQVKFLLAFGAKADVRNKEDHTPVDLAQTNKKDKESIITELQRPVPTLEKRKDNATRFKQYGNKVFLEGENFKAERFYTLAIQNEPTNHILFSNRAACRFNMPELQLALFDAERCLALASTWPRGYFRKAGTLKCLKRFEEAKKTIEQGLKYDNTNKDLLHLKEDLAALA